MSVTICLGVVFYQLETFSKQVYVLLHSVRGSQYTARAAVPCLLGYHNDRPGGWMIRRRVCAAAFDVWTQSVLC